MVTQKICHSKVKCIYVFFHSCPLTPNRMWKHAHHDFELHSKNGRHFDHHSLCEYSRTFRPCCLSDCLQTNLLNQWTGYLVAEALIPAYQISTDDFAGALANQTNLAIKGVIGIQAMAEISGMLGDTTNQQNYSVGTSNGTGSHLTQIILVNCGQLCTADSELCHCQGWTTPRFVLWK